VPLSDRAIEILRSAFAAAPASELVFTSEKDKPFSDMTFTEALRRLEHPFTMHGFRSTFRDRAAEQTAFPREVCEAALSPLRTTPRQPTSAVTYSKSAGSLGAVCCDRRGASD
jgi:integrase